ncbi:hypothetical protein ACVWYQ_000541 [Bradyrhizobium sp. USDA 3397]
MSRHKAIVLTVSMLAGAMLGARQADAQTFQTYRCADGTQFIWAFTTTTSGPSSRSMASR